MSIAITAPLKFDFQDIACVALMLRFAQLSGACFYVEPKDGEDGELHFDAAGSGVIAEIQVKGASGPVTLAEVASCLAHTPANTEKNTLLERLLADPSRLAVLVMSGRCDDACARYTVRMDWAGSPHGRGHVNATQTMALLTALAATEPPGVPSSKLKARRKAHNAELVKTADRKKVQAALSRLIIIEKLDEAGLESFCAEQLRSQHRIPGDRLNGVTRLLREIVKIAKTEGVDAFPLVRAELKRAMPPPIHPIDYIDRGAEPDLTHELSTNGVLLLTGTPRVGKTWAARKIAAEFELHGYEVREFNDVEQTERFLLESTDAPRLALLDDPLGGAHPVAQPAQALSRLAALISRLFPHRKLIVAQEEGRLLATARRAKEIGALSTAGRSWRSLNDLPATFLAEIWDFLANRFAVPSPLRERVLTALSDGSLQLEPGCLQHLAVNHANPGGAADMDGIIRKAREDAADLGLALVQDTPEPLLSALALASTPQESIDFTSLAYVTGAGGDGLPGKANRMGVIIKMGGSASPVPSAPRYDVPPELSGDYRSALDTLEQRRLVSIDAADAVGFAHPFYRAAAESLLDAPTHERARRMISTVQRGLFCLSQQTSRATARNLDWVFDKLSTRIEQAALIDTAAEGLRSYFPATRDLCFQFLLRHLEVMAAEQRHEIPRWVSAVTSIGLHDLQWTNGQAHLAYGEILGSDYFDHIFGTVAREDVETELALLEDTVDAYISPERAARTLQFLVSEPSALTRNAIGRLLSYDEAALRTEAIRLWLQVAREDDEAVLVRIFSDDHPSCARAALKGAVAGWPEYDEPRRRSILQGLVTLASNTACAAAMLDRLVLFNRVDETGENPPWPIFEIVLPVVMAALPHNAAFVDARLFDVARNAVKVLPATSIVAICDGWIDWLERNAEEGRLPSEFSLGVTEILVSGTRGKPELRASRVERLLDFQGTGALLPFVADLIDAWDDLTEEEQVATLRRLQSGRDNDRWLQAVALTRSDTPTVIQQALLGTSLTLNDGADALLAGMPPHLLTASFHVYTGYPQPLWWLGTHHHGKIVWETVVERIARSPGHPLFELAWDHIYGDGARVANVIQDVGAEHADRMLGILIRLKLDRTGDFMPEAWAELLSLAANDEEYAAFISRMAGHASTILDSLSDLWLWLTRECDLEAMLKRLENDVAPISIAHAMELAQGAEVEETQASLAQLLETMIGQCPPRLFGTCDRLLNELERHKIDAPVLRQALQTRREAILKQREHTEALLKQADPPLDGWIKP